MALLLLNCTIPSGNGQLLVRPCLLLGQPVHPFGLLRLGVVEDARMMMLELASKTLVPSSFGTTTLDIVDKPPPGVPLSVAHFMAIDTCACAGDPGTTFPDVSLSQATTGPEIVTSLLPPLVQVEFAVGTRPTLVS